MAIQWYRADDAAKTNPVLIAGADDEQYNSTLADVGKYIYSSNGGIQTNALGPIETFPLSSISLTPMAVIDAEAMALGSNSAYTDAQGNVWTPYGATSWNVAEENGRKVIQFTGTGFLSLRNTNTALWKKLHDGTTDYTIIIKGRAGAIANPNTIYGLLGSSAGSNVNVGIALSYDDRDSQSRNNAATFLIHNATSTTPGPVINAVALNSLPANTPVCLVLTWKAVGTSNLNIYVNRSLVSTQTKTSATPSTANPTYAMEVGAGGNGVIPLIGAINFFGVYEGIISETERKRVEGGRGIAPHLPEINRNLQVIADDGRYNSFGTIASTPDKDIYAFRSGSSHFENGRVDLMDYDRTTKVWSNRRTIYTPGTLKDVRDPRLGVLNDKLIIFFITAERDSTKPNYNNIDTWGYMTSTDLTGNSWNSRVVIPHGAAYAYGTPFGDLQRIDADTFMIGYWKATAITSTATWAQGYLKSTDGGTTWIDTEVRTGSDFRASETALLYCGGTKLLMITRIEYPLGINAGLVQMVSSDLGATWTAMARTNMGGATGVSIPCLHYDADQDQITCVFHDRTDGWVYVSAHNPTATIFASPTGWKTPVKYEFNDNVPKAASHKGLGYPGYNGNLIIWADEDSDTVAKLQTREENMKGVN